MRRPFAKLLAGERADGMTPFDKGQDSPMPAVPAAGFILSRDAVVVGEVRLHPCPQRVVNCFQAPREAGGIPQR